MAVRRVDHQEIDARLDQRLGPLQPGGADAGRGADPQPPVRVLAGMRERLGFLDVLDGHQADQAVVVVDHQELLDPVPVQELLGLLARDAVAHRDQVLGGHQLAHRHARVGREAHVAIGEDADQAARLALDHGDAGDPLRRHQLERVGKARIGTERDRVDHHAGLELLDLADLVRLRRRVEIAMENAEPAVLRHGDREVRLGDRVHGGRDQRDAELDLARQPGADVDLGGQDRGMRRLEQDIIERQSFPDLPCSPLHDHLAPQRWR